MPDRKTVSGNQIVATFNCSIVTPSESILDDEVTQVEFPQWDGQRGILAGAAPFVAKLGAGRLSIRYPEGGSHVFMLAGGFAEMHDNTLVIVADAVAARESLNLAEAEERLAAAVTSATEPGHTDLDEREQLEMNRQKANVEVMLAREQAGKGVAV